MRLWSSFSDAWRGVWGVSDGDVIDEVYVSVAQVVESSLGPMAAGVRGEPDVLVADGR